MQNSGFFKPLLPCNICKCSQCHNINAGKQKKARYKHRKDIKMETPSKVYFTDMRTDYAHTLLEKLDALIVRAGIDKIDFNGKFTAIKINFGEPGNLAFLRPNFAKVVAQRIKALGGKPFLTDCSTLYVGQRKNALDHLDAANENGFNPTTCGCQIIIADGLNGADERLVSVENGEYVKEAKIGTAIMEADIVISLNHFKGHEGSGFGGALKNLGMGCGSRAGKMEQHNEGKPVVDKELCVGCRRCTTQCAHGAITVTERKATIDHSKCVGCGRCISACRPEAISVPGGSANDNFCRKMAEYAKAVVQHRPSFHINIVMDVSPFCDCHRENDAAIIPDVGMLASFDPVALDRACADLCNRMPIIPNTQLSENRDKGIEGDHFHVNHPSTDWRVTLEHAEKIGIGTQQYELIEI